MTQTLQSGPPFNVSFAGSPNRYLPGESRPNTLTTHQAAQVQNWTLGDNRFPTQAQTPYLHFSSFAYPAAVSPGNPGRNVFGGQAVDAEGAVPFSDPARREQDAVQAAAVWRSERFV